MTKQLKQNEQDKIFLAGKPTRDEVIKFVEAKISVLMQSFNGYLGMRETALYGLLIEKGLITEADIESMEKELNEKLQSMKPAQETSTEENN